MGQPPPSLFLRQLTLLTGIDRTPEIARFSSQILPG
jgi:hypothetical protein